MKRLVKMAASMLSAAIIFSSGLFVTDSNAVTIPGTGYVIDACFFDPVFNEYVHLWVDTDRNGLLSSDEINAVTELYINKDVADLSGIELFTKLNSLSCIETQISTLDLSDNVNLRVLHCNSNPNLVYLNVSKNTELWMLQCSNNALTKLDISNLINLESLDCSKNKLTSLDISKNYDLDNIDCSGNQLTTLDVSNNNKLLYLYCYDNNLTNIKLENPDLKILMGSNNNLESVDISDCYVLNDLCEVGNRLDEYEHYYGRVFYDIAGWGVQYEDPNFHGMYEKVFLIDSTTSLYSNDDILFEGQTAPNTHLVAINDINFPDTNFRNYIASDKDSNSDGFISYSEIQDTKYIECIDKRIYSVKGSEFFTNIDSFAVPFNELSEVNLSCFPELKILYVSGNELTSLDISKNPKLENILCDGNELTGIDTSNNPELNNLFCPFNNIQSFDFSNNPKLVSIHCNNNQLTSLDLNTNTELQYLNCAVNSLSELDISNNPKLKELYCNTCQIKELNLTNNKNLEVLYCQYNELTEIDVSNCTKLDSFFLHGNNISYLDLSKNTELRSTGCVNNDTSIILQVYIGKNKLINDLISSVEVIHNVAPYEYVNAWLEYENGEDSAATKWFVISGNAAIFGEDGYIYLHGTASTYVTPTPEPTPTEEPGGTVDPGTTTPITSEVTKVPTPTNNPTSAPVVDPTNAPTLEATVTVGPVPTSEPTEAPSKSVGSFVDRCYSVALGRDADEAGYEYWLDALNNGEICGAQAGYGFIFSGEYANKETTNEEFVTDLYSMYFGRTPDEGGFNYWVGLLNSGASREEVFAGFANSTEFDNLCADYGVVTGAYLVGVPVAQQGGVNSFVARLFNICLTRRPDQAGQAGWAQKLIAGEITGTTCAFGFVFSPEFIGKEPSNEEFVAYMYRAFFGREADEAGFTAWVSTLNGGGTYEDVFAGFSGSAEFANLCASYGIQA